MRDHVSMRRLRGRWLGVTFVLAALVGAGLMAWLAVYLRKRGLEWDAKLSEIVSAAMVVGAAVFSAAGKVARWLPAPKLKDEQVESDVADLAAALRIQGRFEGVLSGLYVYDRLPMPVRWKSVGELSSGPRPRSPDPAHAREAVAGSFDEVMEYFRQLPESRLLVLGSAGGGKTVLVTELARRLLAARKVGDPVPVTIPVTAWDPRQTSLFDWVSDQLVRINADLAQRVSDGRRYVTRAQALVDRQKVLPILDGIDEVVEEARPMATLAVNRYGWTQPLVVTCRTDEYLQAITAERGTPIARVAAVTLQPLEIADIKGYLGPDRDEHWKALYDRLDAEPHGALAIALANPLMLWLAWAVYSGDGRRPAELADRGRFGSRDAIEHHLLAEFVPAVYPESKKRQSEPVLHRLLSSAPRRWLGFLAADKYLHSRSKGARARQPIDLFETRDAQNVAWWRFTGAARGYRIVGVIIRAALLWAVIWRLVLFELRRNGYWRHGSFAGPVRFRELFLSGSLGRTIWPTVRRVINVVPEITRRHAFSGINTFLSTAFQPPSAGAITVAIVVFLVGAAVYANMESARPRHLHISMRQVAACAGIIVRDVLFLALVIWAVLALWHKTNLASSIFTARSTWYAVIAVGLVTNLPGIPFKLLVQTDVVGAVTPLESLRMDRWADIAMTSTRRAIVAGVIVLLSGTQLALSYLVFAAASTLVAVVLGGRRGSASRSYTDACIWLGLTGRLPWRPMRFLIDAQRRGVFQEIGAIFRFRHARVQRQLRDWYEDYRPGLQQSLALYRRVTDRLRASSNDRAATLVGARERVESYRVLADQNLAEFGPDLARALGIQAALLRDQGYRDEELDTLAQLVATHRQLAELDSAATAALAGSLDQFAWRLSEAGRNDEALGVMTEAAEIYCPLAVTDRTTYQPALEKSLTWLGRHTAPGGRIFFSAHAADAVLNRYRDLVLDEPGHGPDARALSLARLAQLLRRHDHGADAVTVMNEAVQIYAEHALTGPATAWADRAKALTELAGGLALSRGSDAAAALANSTLIYRELVLLEPAKYRPLLIRSLCGLAALYAELDRGKELRAIRQAVSEYRAVAQRLSDQRSAARGATDLGDSAGRDLASDGGDLAPPSGDFAPGHREPDPRCEESTPGRGEPGSGELPLAWLSRLAMRLWKLGVQDAAVEAAGIGRELSAARPGDSDAERAVGRPRLIWDVPTGPDIGSATSTSRRTSRDELTSLVDRHDLQAFRFLLAGRGDESHAEAVKAAGYCRQLVTEYRRLADTRPADYLRDLAKWLDLLATQLHKAGAAEDEAAAAGEALLIRRRLGDSGAEPTVSNVIWPA
jgi:hypothetical protein